MKMFASDLWEKNVMSSDGKFLGTVDNLVCDTKTGKILHILIIPSEELDLDKYRLDSQERVVLPFEKVKSAKDVVVMAPLKE